MTTLDPSHFPDLSFHQHKPSSSGKALYTPPQKGLLRLPVIPDLRFEYSYLKSISQCVRTRLVKDGELDRDGHLEVQSINWRRVAWITTRDQLLSPFLQGAVLGLFVVLLRPIFTSFRNGVRSFFSSMIPRSSPSKPAITLRPSTLRDETSGTYSKRFREWSESLETNTVLS